MPPDLKPCPFCKCAALDTTEFRGQLDSVGCSGCGALMLRSDKRPDVAARWNNRPTTRRRTNGVDAFAKEQP